MALPQEKRYTYADLLEWDEEVRYELYDGMAVALAAPSIAHQRISRRISSQLENYLEGKKCEAFYAPVDVCLFEEAGDRPENINFVLQPDLMVVCDPRKVGERGIHGAPDMVVEILSDSTRQYDKLDKFNLYQQAGVKEYWIVDPSTRTVSVYTLEDKSYHAAAVYTENLSVPVGVLEDCSIDLSTIFADI